MWAKRKQRLWIATQNQNRRVVCYERTRREPDWKAAFWEEDDSSKGGVTKGRDRDEPSVRRMKTTKSSKSRQQANQVMERSEGKFS